jgi:zinc protease
VGGRSSDGGVLNLIEAREQYGRTLAWDEQMDAKLANVTLDQINTAFRRHINAESLSIVKGGDFKAAKVYQ